MNAIDQDGHVCIFEPFGQFLLGTHKIFDAKDKHLVLQRRVLDECIHLRSLAGNLQNVLHFEIFIRGRTTSTMHVTHEATASCDHLRHWTAPYAYRSLRDPQGVIQASNVWTRFSFYEDLCALMLYASRLCALTLSATFSFGIRHPTGSIAVPMPRRLVVVHVLFPRIRASWIIGIPKGFAL